MRANIIEDVAREERGRRGLAEGPTSEVEAVGALLCEEQQYRGLVLLAACLRCPAPPPRPPPSHQRLPVAAVGAQVVPGGMGAGVATEPRDHGLGGDNERL